MVADGEVPNGNVPALLSWAGRHPDSVGQPPLLQFNHPRDPDRNLKDYGRDDYPPADWVRTLDPFVELIEILNAPWKVRSIPARRPDSSVPIGASAAYHDASTQTSAQLFEMAAAWERKTIAGFVEAYAPDVILVVPFGTYRGRNAVVGWARQL